MNGIPQWWLDVSAAFFALNILLFIGLMVAIVFMIKFINALTPKVAQLESSVQGLVAKVHTVADRVEEVATSVKETVDGVGGRAKGVVGSMELVAQTASRQFERFSPFVVGAVTAIRLVKALNQARTGKGRGHAQDKTNLNGKKPKLPLLSLLGK